MKAFARIIFYCFIGLVLGTLGGAFMGFVFGIAVTKKSEIETRQNIQVPIFSVIGAIAGICIGAKFASDEEQREEEERQMKIRNDENERQARIRNEQLKIEEERKKQEYQASLVTIPCKNCSSVTTYSTLKPNPLNSLCSYCQRDVLTKVSNFKSMVDSQFDNLGSLKQRSAKVKRMEKVIEAAIPLIKFEEMGISFYSPTAQKTIEIAKENIEYYNSKG